MKHTTYIRDAEMLEMILQLEKTTGMPPKCWYSFLKKNPQQILPYLVGEGSLKSGWSHRQPQTENVQSENSQHITLDHYPMQHLALCANPRWPRMV